MPIETKDAVQYALDQGAVENYEIVDKVRQYFNDNNIGYDTFSYADLEPYFN